MKCKYEWCSGDVPWGRRRYCSDRCANRQANMDKKRRAVALSNNRGLREPGIRKIRKLSGHNSLSIVIPSVLLEVLGWGKGDSLRFEKLPDGLRIWRAP